MFYSHSLIQNALVNNDDALVNFIKQSLTLKIVKSNKFSLDYLLTLVHQRKLLEMLMQKTSVMVLLLEPKGQIFLPWCK